MDYFLSTLEPDKFRYGRILIFPNEKNKSVHLYFGIFAYVRNKDGFGIVSVSVDEGNGNYIFRKKEKACQTKKRDMNNIFRDY